MDVADERQGFVTDPTDDERVRWAIHAAALGARLDLKAVAIDRDLEVIDVVVRVGWFRAFIGVGLDYRTRDTFRIRAREMLGMCGLHEYVHWPLVDSYVR